MVYQPQASAFTGTSDIGTIISYVEFTTDVSITHTTEATADVVVTAATFVPNGSDQVWIEFFAPGVNPPSVATASCIIVIYDNGSSINAGHALIAQVTTPAASTMIAPVMARLKLTPTAAPHAYSIRAFSPAGTSSVRGSSGATGQAGYVCITKAA